MLFYILVAAISIIILYFLTGYILARQILYLKRQPIIKTPDQYGMDYENIEFRTSDNVDIKGWFIPKESSNKLLIFVHVGSFNRHGLIPANQGLIKLYDKEVEMLKTAKNYHNQGYNIILFDLRNHGESGSNRNNGLFTVGLDESKDISGLMHYIKRNDKLNKMEIYIAAFCTGANSVIIAMSKEKETFKDVKALVSIQAVTMDVFNKVYLRTRLTSIGSIILMPVIRFWVKLLTGYETTDMSPKDYVKDIPCPTLFIQAKHDPWTEAQDYQTIYDNAPQPKKLILLEEPIHRFDTYRYFEDRPELILEWFKKF